MGEEEKKIEEPKKTEEEKKEEPKAEESKEVAKGEESKDPAPPPPPEIVLRVYMHCEGCARKVRRCLKGFEGVEDVLTDYKTQKVVVKGEKADPVKILARVQKKSHRQVELLSPIPKPPAEEPPKTEEKEAAKPEEKEEEPQVIITVVLKVHMHCEACSLEIKRRIEKMKGVEKAEPDLKSSQVTVTGVFEPEKLLEYVHRRTGKHAAIVKKEPEEKKEEEKEKGKEEEKKVVEEPEKDGGKKGKEAEAGEEKKDGGGGAGEEAAKPEGGSEEEPAKVEMKKNEMNYYYQQPQNYQMHTQRFAQEFYAYPPQIFSDENPNACSVM